MNDELALFGGTPALPEMPHWCEPLEEDEIAAATEALRTVPITTLYGGYEIEEFEKAYASHCGTGFGVAVNSGTSALNAAMVAAGIGPGDEVITTPLSFVATTSTIVQTGAQPVFADVEPESACLDPKAVEKAITERTKAIVPVHFCGYPADMKGINEVARRHGLVVIEDAAQAHGARIDGQHVGSFGDFGCFSFNIGKVLRTGEGGMVLTNSEAHAKRLREIRVNGMFAGPDGGARVERIGFNYSMPQPLAAIGRRQVARHPQALENRRRNAEILLAAIEAAPGISPLPDLQGRERVPYYLQFPLDDEFVPLRDRIVAALRAENVAAMPSRAPLYHIDYLRDLCPDAYCPEAERIAERTIWIDVLQSYSLEQMHGMARGIEKVFGRLADLRAQDAQAGL